MVARPDQTHPFILPAGLHIRQQHPPIDGPREVPRGHTRLTSQVFPPILHVSILEFAWSVIRQGRPTPGELPPKIFSICGTFTDSPVCKGLSDISLCCTSLSFEEGHHRLFLPPFAPFPPFTPSFYLWYYYFCFGFITVFNCMQFVPVGAFCV